MTSIGETLRRERVRRKLELEKIASETKISARLLQAIEAEQFEKLPGGVFARSFVRQYATLLGLDADELVSELDRQLQSAAAPVEAVNERKLAPATPIRVPRVPDIRLPKVEEWRDIGESRFQFSGVLPALAMVVLVMLLCSGIYAWWQRARVRPAPAPEFSAATAPNTPPPAARPTPAAPLPAGAAPTAIAPPVQAGRTDTAPVTSPPVAPSDRKPSEVKPPEPKPADARAAINPPEAAPPVKRPAPNPNAAVRVQLTATEPTWVLVRTDGKFLFSGTLQANESREVDASDAVQVRLGNAGTVTISLNGKPLGSVGPKGQVRTVQLTSGGFQIVPVSAPPKVPVPLDPL